MNLVVVEVALYFTNASHIVCSSGTTPHLLAALSSSPDSQICTDHFPRFTPEDIMPIWSGIRPGIKPSRARWTAAETKRLMDITKMHGGRDWEKISIELAADRHPMDCLSKWSTEARLAARPMHRYVYIVYKYDRIVCFV